MDIYQDEILVNNINKAIEEYSIDIKKNRTYRPFFKEMYDIRLEHGNE